MKSVATTALVFLLAVTHVQADDEVRIEKDVPYLGADRTEKLDLYIPPGHTPQQRVPAVVIIHGGGWVGGDKGRAREINIGTTLANAGYLCASINYVLGDAGTDTTFAEKLNSVWPRNLNDCRTAVRFLRSRADEYGIDPERIGAIGGSAGGHLTAMLGYADDDPDDAERLYPEFSSRVQAVVPMYGPQDLVFRAREDGVDDPGLLALCRDASSVERLTTDDPPTLILHGTADTTVALRQSELLAEACRRVGIEFELRIVEGAPHSFHLQPSGHDLRPLVVGFFDRYLKGPPRTIPRELRRERFQVQEHSGFVIWPTKTRSGPTPWVMYAPTFDPRLPGEAEAWMFRQFLDAGIAIAGVDVGESYGSPQGRAVYTALYQRLTSEHGLDPKACLLARSRGGLMAYGWAADNPDKVRCIAGIYPVCNLASYPGLDRACGAFGLTAEELAARLSDHNPVDRVAPLAEAGIPVYHIHGDADEVVPLDANSELLAERLRAAGGEMEVNVAPGQGHNMWRGFFECQGLVDFVIGNAVGEATE